MATRSCKYEHVYTEYKDQCSKNDLTNVQRMTQPMSEGKGVCAAPQHADLPDPTDRPQFILSFSLFHSFLIFYLHIPLIEDVLYAYPAKLSG